MDAPTASPSRGRCLTEAEIASLKNPASGGVPRAQAEHIAGCNLCQDRLLASELSSKKSKRPAEARELMPPTGRFLVFVGLLLAAVALFFLTLRRLLGE